MYESNVSTKKYILINLNIYCHTLIWLGPMNLLKINTPPPFHKLPSWFCHHFDVWLQCILISISYFEVLTTFIIYFIKVLFQEFVAIFWFSFERYYLYTTMCLSTVWCTMYFLCILYRYIVLWSVTFISNIVGYFDFNKPW